MKSSFTPLSSKTIAALGQDNQCLNSPVRTCSESIDAYHTCELLGQGSTGAVFRACRKADQQDVALKIIRTQEEEQVLATKQEYELLKNLRHPYIIKVLDFISFPRGIALVMEYFPGSNLKLAVRHAPSRRLPEAAARELFLKLIQAIDYLHRNNIIHRDIKADNILVSAQLDDLRLIDFNVAGLLTESLTMTGTVEYMPPEVLRGHSPTAAGDVWGAGLSLYLMLSGKLPMDRKGFSSRYELGNLISVESTLQLSSSVSDHVSSACKAVLRSCLEPDPVDRAQAEVLLGEQWLQ